MTDCPLIALLNGIGSTVEVVAPNLTSLSTHPLNPEVKSPDEVNVTLGDPPVTNVTNIQINFYYPVESQRVV